MKLKNNRKAFSMLMAIFVIFIMASIGTLVMSLSGKLVKETTAQYQREQAVLLANSYTEYAVMAVTANDRSTNCLSTINGTWNGYSARIEIAYIGTASVISNCDDERELGTVSVGSDTPLTIIVDAYVDYKDLDNLGGQNMTYHKRTVQKI